MNEWEAFNRIQPIGARRYDVYFSQLMLTLHNIAVGFSGSKTAKQFNIKDFIPNWAGIVEEEPEMNAEQMKQFWLNFIELKKQDSKKGKQ